MNDENKVYFFGNLIRGYGLHGKGLKKRGETLYNSYLFNNINYCHNDYVIDCDENYGDLWLSLAEEI
jgi:hypothetical protein